MLRALPLLTIIAACANPATRQVDPLEELLNSPSEHVRQTTAHTIIFKENRALLPRARETLRRAERSVLSPLQTDQLLRREPALGSELVWRTLRHPSLDRERLAWMAPYVLHEGKRELVDILRRVDPEGRQTEALLFRAISRAPVEADRAFLRDRLGGAMGAEGAAAGLVRLGDLDGLLPLFREEICDREPGEWLGLAQRHRDPEALLRDDATSLHQLLRSRFDDTAIVAALRKATETLPPPMILPILSHLAGRMKDVDTLRHLTTYGEPEAAIQLAAFPGPETLDVLRRALVSPRNYEAALVSLALLGDPQLSRWIAEMLERLPRDPDAAHVPLLLRRILEPVPAEPAPLAEIDPPRGVVLQPLAVYQSWSSVTSEDFEKPHEFRVDDREEWAAFWRRVQWPAPAVDFTRHTALVLLYPDSDTDTISDFEVQVAGTRTDGDATVIHVVHVRAQMGRDLEDHGGTCWRVLLVPQTRVPIRFAVEERTRR